MHITTTFLGNKSHIRCAVRLNVRFAQRSKCMHIARQAQKRYCRFEGGDGRRFFGHSDLKL